MSTITYSPPFTVDTIINALGTVTSPLFAVIIPAIVALYDYYQSASPIALSSLDGLKEFLFSRYRWCGYVVIFILVRAINDFLSRRARNNGVLTPDKPKWDRDVVVVTGGATGIGANVVRVLSRNHRAKIAVLDICEPTYEPAANGAPEILFIKTDVSSTEAIAKAHATIREHFGTSPSYVIGVAGVVRAGRLLDTEPEYIRRTFEINSLAHVIQAREFLPAMLERNHGHYVTVASSASYYGPPMLGPYCISKAAALSFHEQLRVELRVVEKRPNVRTSVFTPTKVKTTLGHGLSSGKLGFFHPDLESLQVALSIVEAVNSGESHNVSQPYITWLLPFARALPAWYLSLIAILGDTDVAVTENSIRESYKIGYASNWSKEQIESVFGRQYIEMQGDAK